jgi:2-dehydro-3-deoxygalactonokinase
MTTTERIRAAREPARSGTSACLLAVDWGTTRFRCWLLARDGGILGERRGDEGLRSAAAAGGFEAILERHAAALDAGPALPAFVCGMAGARGGWREAPYLDLPAELATLAEAAVRVPVARPTFVLPGLARRGAERRDVMRGEETQLLGLAPGDALVCLPGTHSKWVRVVGGRVADFATSMTGELFDLLCRRSVLAPVVGDGAVDPADPDFTGAVGEGLAEPGSVTDRLFGLRADWLLDGTAPERSRARLSGLLVGAELAGAHRRFGPPEATTLVASGPLADLYAAALASVGTPAARIVPAEACVRAGLLAAARILLGGPA